MKRKPLRIVTCCLAGTLLTAVPVYSVEAAPVAGVSEYANTVVENELNTSLPVAGVSLAMTGYLEETMTEKPADAEKAESDQVQSAGADSDIEDQDKKEQKKEEKKTSKYDNMAVAQVSDYVNIRKKPSEDAELVGKLYSNSVATVLKKKGGWYKIESGSVTGYVKGDYIVVGDEELVKSVGVQIATVSTTTLKVRSKASGKSEVLTLVPGGEELTVASMKQYKDGWVKVAVDGGKGYVSSDFVELTRQYTYAESKAEEEARLALEEARREEEARQEEAARAAETADQTNTTAGTSNGTSTGASSNSTGSSTGTGSNSTGSSAGTSSNSTGSSAGTGSNSSGSSAAASAGPVTGSSSGQAVVNYASQFIGNPYVYGGSSLTGGTDCSGFVMSVYAHFGVSLPHSSSALRGVGRGVSASSMQPGDIVCYSGHVAIYVGGNTIIHASNPATGIKYTSPANYRPILAVRRIF